MRVYATAIAIAIAIAQLRNEKQRALNEKFPFPGIEIIATYLPSYMNDSVGRYPRKAKEHE